MGLNHHRSTFLIEHDLFGKPLRASPDHAPRHEAVSYKMAAAVYQNIDIIESYGARFIGLLASDHILQKCGDYQHAATACQAGHGRNRRLP
jgi:ADP-glucose pyrophosphorylase